MKWNRFLHLSLVCLIVLVSTMAPRHAGAAAPGVRVLYSFSGGADGQNPDCELIADNLGSIYGTTVEGGLYSSGTVFELTTTPVHHAVLYNFTGGSDGAQPYGGLVMDGFGNLYGVTKAGGNSSCPGGCGVIYELKKSGNTYSYVTLHAFTGGRDGSNPVGQLVIYQYHPDKFALYGTTTTGGTQAFGTVYELKQDDSASWKLSVLHTFTGGQDGAGGTSLWETHRHLFGVSSVGGANANGSIFDLAVSAGSWQFGNYYSFVGPNDGASPVGGVTSFETFYGSAYSGGTYGQGTIYEFQWGSGAKAIHNFTGLSDGGNPLAHPATDDSGLLYGTTSSGGDPNCNCGTIFRLSANGKGGWTFNTAYQFPGAPGPGRARNGLYVFGGIGNTMYGTTVDGGESNHGTIYQFMP